MASPPVEKVGGALDFWVAQRFTAAISGLFSAAALATVVKLHAARHFSRKGSLPDPQDY